MEDEPGTSARNDEVFGEMVHLVRLRTVCTPAHRRERMEDAPATPARNDEVCGQGLWRADGCLCWRIGWACWGY